MSNPFARFLRNDSHKYPSPMALRKRGGGVENNTSDVL